MTDVMTTYRGTSTVEVSFSWSPSSTDPTTGAPNATSDTDLVFTAIATVMVQDRCADLLAPITIIEYHWDFGDGITLTGNPVTHSYVWTNYQAQTVLRVTDSEGRQWFTRQQMYLYE